MVASRFSCERDEDLQNLATFGTLALMMTERTSYPMDLVVNGRQIDEVVIDPHYREKHPDITDALILDLVKGLDGREFQVQERDGEWEFFMLDRIEHPLGSGKLYRLVWCLHDSCLFLGVINCFRR